MTDRRPVLLFRWLVFLLTAGYVLDQLIFGGWSAWGGPLRFLTIWALVASCFSATRMLSRSRGRTERRWDVLVNVTAVINLMVVLLYWRLFFGDPTSVTRSGHLGSWWREGYLHAAGPLLQWIDALFLHRAFRRLGVTVGWLLGTIGAYVAWIEAVVRPLNDTPAGRVESGLPYRFLNHLDVAGRAAFYGTNVGFAVVALLALAGLAWAIRRRWPRPEPPGPA